MVDSANVRVAVTGAWYMAPLGTTAPASATASLPGTWVELGFLSDDGTTKSTDRSTDDITAWQNASKVRTVVTDSGVTFQFTLIETTVESVELYTGGTVSADGTVSVAPGRTGGRHAFVFDIIDGDFVRRIFIPEAEVTDLGDQSYTSSDPIGYDITLSGYASAALNGDTYLEFIPALATAG